MTDSRGGGGREGPQARTESPDRWLAAPSSPAEIELRQALDQAVAREADEVALRRVWARLAEMPALVPPAHPEPASAADLYGQESFLRRRIRWPWIVAASLAGATAVMAFMLIRGDGQVRTLGLENDRPRAATGAARHEPADERSALVAPATVRTGRGETLHLSLQGGTDVVVKSESTLVLDENDHPAVATGEVEFHVPPQAPGHTFTVTADHYRVVVVGTRFRVRMSQKNAAVGVDEGVVEVREVWSDRRLARITAGQSWSSPLVEATAGGTSSPEEAAATSGAAAAAPAANVAAPAEKPGARVLRGSKAWRSLAGTSHAGKGRPAREPDGSRHLLAMTTPSVSGSVTGSPSGSSPGSATAAMTFLSSGGEAAASAKATEAMVAEALVPPTVTPPPAPAPGPPDAAALAMQARAAQAAGDSHRALDLYRLLAQRQGAVGENAEYEIGRVLRDGMHLPREAVSAWREYRTQHPRGMLRIEADISVIETLASVGDKTGALAEASEFIRRYPESERRMEVARLAGDLLRERGDCGGAIEAYNVAMASGRVRRELADGVSFHRSSCLLRRDRAKGQEALRGYLRSFPGGRYRTDAEQLLGETQSPALAPRP